MLSGLLLTAFLMGLGGIPHCAAMCGAACAVAFPKGLPLPALLGRCLGYATLGAVAAASAGLASRWGREWAFVQPLWILFQAAAVALGVWMLWSGRVPAQLDAWGQGLYHWVRSRWGAGMDQARMPSRAARAAWGLIAGGMWAVLPCGLLYAAVVVAALAPHVWGGALVMLAFALPSALGVWGAPAVLRLLSRGRTAPEMQAGGASPLGGLAGSAPTTAVPVIWMKPAMASSSDALLENGGKAPVTALAWRDPVWAVRLSGLSLMLMASWALYHQVQSQWQAWCA